MTDSHEKPSMKRNPYLKVGFRYQVYKGRGVNLLPQFSAPWYWLAQLYATVFCGNAEYCKMIDAKTGKPIYEWARATIHKSDR